MNLKLDENLGRSAAVLLREAGHDVSTVQDQDLCAASDRRLHDVCASEGRTLVTLDLDFSNPVEFPPGETAGIVVLRLRAAPALPDILDALRTLVHGLAHHEVAGRLWVVSRGRIREYEQRS